MILSSGFMCHRLFFDWNKYCWVYHSSQKFFTESFDTFANINVTHRYEIVEKIGSEQAFVFFLDTWDVWILIIL